MGERDKFLELFFAIKIPLAMNFLALFMILSSPDYSPIQKDIAALGIYTASTIMVVLGIRKLNRLVD